jgi:hypothetical protein
MNDRVVYKIGTGGGGGCCFIALFLVDTCRKRRPDCTRQSEVAMAVRKIGGQGKKSIPAVKFELIPPLIEERKKA